MNLKHGLCALLGKGEYVRRILENKRRNAGTPPRKFTGLSLKTMTTAEYHRQYRKLKRERIA